MVYCGKPSQGCGECRARKIKCDQTQPECTRCLRANRPCPGYRDQLSLQFRDESQSVIQRAKAEKHTADSETQRKTILATDINSRIGVDDHSISENAYDPQQQYYFLPLNPFRVDIKDQASCFFFHTYSWVGDSTLFKSDRPDHPHAPLGERALLAGAVSVGQASLANIMGSDSLKLSASRQYATALNHTNAALRDPVQVRQDTTLTAVLLLSLYEVVSSATPKSIDAWTKHVNGAITLLEMHKPESTYGPRPLTAFFALRNSLINGCLHRRIPIPSSLIEMSGQAAEIRRSPIATCAHQLTEIMAKLADLRAEIAKGDCDPPEAISRARSLDADMSAWVQGLSPSCYFDVYVNPGPFWVNKQYHISPYKGLSYTYSGVWLCNVWNNYRLSRIHVDDIILTRLRPLVSDPNSDTHTRNELLAECRVLRDRMRQLACDICHSAPYQLGVLDESKASRQNPVIKSSAGGFLLLYPLCIAVSVDGSSSPLCSWALECFHVVAHAMGINQAITLRNLMQTMRSDPVTWVDQLDSDERV